MRKKSFFFSLFLTVLLLVRGELLANATQRIVWDDKIFADVGEVSMGMKLDSKTRMDGDEMIHFRLRVISIDDSYVKKQYILAEIEDKLFHETGVLAGMSGSPVYFNGRLLGAISATRMYLKKPIVIITSIRSMLEVQRHFETEQDQGSDSQNVSVRRFFRPRYAKSAQSGAFSDFFSAWDMDLPVSFFADDRDHSRFLRGKTMVPQRIEQNEAHSQFFSQLKQTTAVSVGGFSRRFVKDFFHSSPANVGGVSFVATAKGRAKSLGLTSEQFEAKANSLEAGDYIGLNLIKGDLNISGYGTVTYVRDDLVFAFGHAMRSEGKTCLPLYKAYVNGVMPSIAFSAKVGSLIKEIGVVKQDRFPAIVGKLGKERASYIPFEVEYQESEKKRDLFSFEIVDAHSYLRPLTFLALRNVWAEYVESAVIDDIFLVDVSIRGKRKTGVQGEKEKDWAINLRERYNSYISYMAGWSLSYFPAKILDEINRNFFNSVTIEKVSVKFQKQPNRFAFIKGVRLAKGRGFFRREETVDLIVSYQLYRSGEIKEKKISYVLPSSLKLGRHTIYISNEQRFMTKALYESGLWSIGGESFFSDFDSFLNHFDKGLWREDRLVVYTENSMSAVKLSGRDIYRRLPFLARQRMQNVVSSTSFSVLDFNVHKEDVSLPIFLDRDQTIIIDIVE